MSSSRCSTCCLRVIAVVVALRALSVGKTYVSSTWAGRLSGLHLVFTPHSSPDGAASSSEAIVAAGKLSRTEVGVAHSFCWCMHDDLRGRSTRMFLHCGSGACVRNTVGYHADAVLWCGLLLELTVMIVVYACMGCLREFRSVRDCHIHCSKSEVAELNSEYQRAGNLLGCPLLHVWLMILTPLCQRKPVTFCVIMCSCAEQICFFVWHVLLPASDTPPAGGAAARQHIWIAILPAVHTQTPTKNKTKTRASLTALLPAWGPNLTQRRRPAHSRSRYFFCQPAHSSCCWPAHSHSR